MTTNPKAKRFRIRRAPAPGTPAGDAQAKAGPGGAQAAAPGGVAQSGPAPTGQKSAPPGAAGAAVARPTPAETEAAIDAIRREGLTGRQLRMARRLAHRHGMSPASDFDAVRLLRKAGIDPFERANMLELVVADTSRKDGNAADAAPKPTTMLPVPVPEGRSGVSADPMTPEQIRSFEIGDIHRDIAARRRRKMIRLGGRLAAFVALPTVLAGFYFSMVATPMFATQSDFVIQQADPAGSAGLGGLLGGTGFATSQDSITVQNYLQSREAMLRLDADLGFKAHFSDPGIDWLQRLAPDATNEDAYAVFKKRVKIGYDPTGGVIQMEVIAADPETSAAFSHALIDYAEQQVDQLTRRLREDSMRGAREVFDKAEADMTAAQTRVLDLQEQLGVLDPASETSTIMSQVGMFEVQLAEKRLALQQLLDNPQPNAARVSGVQGDIARLETLIADLRRQLTDSDTARGSLAQVSSRLRMAQVELETRTLMMQESLQSLESARIEANRQVRYLSMGVNPVPPDEASYPKAWQNTAVAFLVFAGIYLMVSLTVSILREQVSG